MIGLWHFWHVNFWFFFSEHGVVEVDSGSILRNMETGCCNVFVVVGTWAAWVDEAGCWPRLIPGHRRGRKAALAHRPNLRAHLPEPIRCVGRLLGAAAGHVDAYLGLDTGAFAALGALERLHVPWVGVKKYGKALACSVAHEGRLGGGGGEIAIGATREHLCLTLRLPHFKFDPRLRVSPLKLFDTLSRNCCRSWQASTAYSGSIRLIFRRAWLFSRRRYFARVRSGNTEHEREREMDRNAWPGPPFARRTSDLPAAAAPLQPPLLGAAVVSPSRDAWREAGVHLVAHEIDELVAAVDRVHPLYEHFGAAVLHVLHR